MVFGPDKEVLLQDMSCFGDDAYKTIFSYDWLICQMEQRIGPRPKQDAYPLWAWYQWDGATRCKPDLRSTGHLSAGTKGVRIELEIAEDQILLSDFDAWYFPYCQCYLARSEQEDTAFEAEMRAHGFTGAKDIPLSHPKLLDKMLTSWERIFDLDYVGSVDWDSGKTRHQKSIQGTFWQLSIDQVRRITPFTARIYRKSFR
jgi:hypothetical protein